MDQKPTGNFEVFVNGDLVHSKKTKGHGFVMENPVQQEVILTAVRQASS